MGRSGLLCKLMGSLSLIWDLDNFSHPLQLLLCVTTRPTYWVSGPCGAFITVACQKERVGGMPSTDKVSFGPSWIDFLRVHIFSPDDAFTATLPQKHQHEAFQREEREERGCQCRTDLAHYSVASITTLRPVVLTKRVQSSYSWVITIQSKCIRCI